MEPEMVDFDMISKFPAEIQCMILETLNRTERTLCLRVSIRWKQIIKSFWPGISANPNMLLRHAAKHGYEELLRFAKREGAERFDLAMRFAAREGHLELMVILKDWSLIKPQKLESPPHLVIAAALFSSALGGNIAGMELAKTWGALKYKEAMLLTAAGGSPEGMKLVKLWIETSSPTFRNINSTNLDDQKKQHIKYILTSAINGALGLSSSTGETECMKLAKEWGADKYNNAMVSASRSCQFEAMKLLRKWGACQFDKSIEAVIKRILNLENRIEENKQKDTYDDHRAGSYIKIKEREKYILIKVPTVSQKDHTLIYHQTELKRMAECLELLKTWKKEEIEGPSGT